MAEEFMTEVVKRFIREIASQQGSVLASTAEPLGSELQLPMNAASAQRGLARLIWRINGRTCAAIGGLPVRLLRDFQRQNARKPEMPADDRLAPHNCNGIDMLKVSNRGRTTFAEMAKGATGATA
jgi:hypothetical protein